MTSQSIFNVNNIAKNINSLSSPDHTFGIYILQEWNHCWATIYVNYVHRLFLRHSVYRTPCPVAMSQCPTVAVAAAETGRSLLVLTPAEKIISVDDSLTHGFHQYMYTYEFRNATQCTTPQRTASAFYSTETSRKKSATQELTASN